MIKKVLSALLSLFIIALCPLTTFAMVATPSVATPSVATSSDVMGIPVATSNDALPSQDYMETDDFDMLDIPMLYSSGEQFSDNTVTDFSQVHLILRYYDMSLREREHSIAFNSSGHASLSMPSDYASSIGLFFRLNKGALPPSGKYEMFFAYWSDTGGYDYADVQVHIVRHLQNSVGQDSYVSVPFVAGSGDFNFNTVIDFTSVSYIQVNSLTKGLIPPCGGNISIGFRPTSSAPVVSGPDISNDQIQSNISDGIQQQVEQGDTIIELIKNTIQTISAQLTAFWNQLAGEFTNLFNKMNQQHTEQLEADRTNTEDMIAAEESNTTNIINNNNANTDKLAYGYDSSAQDQKNDELGSKLDEYDSAESEIFDSVSGNISDFNMDDYKIEDSSLLAGIVWVSDFMQQLFVSMGLFNLPVTISLVLIFVVIMIGYYRIRS